MRRLFTCVRNLLQRNRVAADVDAEIRAAFDLLADEKIARGMSPADARRATTIEMGSILVLTEQVRDVKAGALAETWLRDLRYGARLLRRNPIFALTAALSLAIGIGATTTIFTVANGLLFRAPAGVSDPDRLVDIFRTEEGRVMANFTVSYPYYRDVRQHITTLVDLYAFEYELQPIALGVDDSAELAFANVVTGNYFAVLGVVPSAGRLLDAADDAEPGANPVAVLSHRYWLRRFNGDPAIVGRTVRINRQPFTVLGVAGEGFKGTNVVSADLWLSMSMVEVVHPGTSRLTNRRQDGVGIGGRLARGVSRAQAAAELEAISRALEHEHPSGTRLRVAGLSSMPGPVAKVAAGFFALLMLLVSVVLVIACANVAGVLLARAAARRREIAVRIAIGAGRARLVRQLLTETMLLFVLAAGAGLLVARGMTTLLLKVLPASPIPVDLWLPLDARVLAFTAGLSLIAAALSGLVPALHVSGADVVSGLKDDAQGPPDRLRARTAFVIAQVACSIALVIVAGLLVRALERTSALDRGFDPRGVEAASLDLARAGYSATSGARFLRELAARVRHLPGVETATVSQELPGAGGALLRVTVPGVAPPQNRTFFTVIANTVESQYFATLRLPLVAGRDFTDADRAGAQPVAIVSETTARRFWPGEDPVGKYMLWHDGGAALSGTVKRVQVIGIARDVKSRGAPPTVRDLRARPKAGEAVLAEPPPPISEPVWLTVYVPLQQQYSPRVTIMARAAAGPVANEIRHLLKSMDPNLLVPTIQPLETKSGPADLQLRIAASVAGSVGLIGLMLAAIGIYGVTAYTTVRRTREIGIRVAMGAQRRDVVAMVLREGMSLVAAGSIAGLMLAAAGSRLFARMLFGVPPLDPVAFGVASLLFAVIGLVACYIPARRATRIDVMEALRYE